MAQTNDWSKAINVRVRVYIPAPTVVAPVGSAFEGDDRGASYDAGQSRLDLEIDFDPATGQSRQQASWGWTRAFNRDDSFPVAGKPSWWHGLYPGSVPIAEDRLAVTPETARASFVAAANGRGGTVTLTYSGANPLISVAPPIDGTFTLTFADDGSFTWTSSHDGFPAHSLYVNGELIHLHDPAVSGHGPFALAGSPVSASGSKRGVAARPANAGDHFRRPSLGGPENPGGGGDGRDGPDDDDRDPHDDDGAGTGGSGGTAGGGAGSGGSGGSGNTGGSANAGGGQGAPAGGSAAGSVAGDGESYDSQQGYSYPIDYDMNRDGSVTLTVGGVAETFRYDATDQLWLGDGGSVLVGGDDMFQADQQWTIDAFVDANGDFHFSICCDGVCTAAKQYENYIQ